MGRRPVPGEDSEFEGDEEVLKQFQAEASAKKEKLLTNGGGLQNGNGYPPKSRSSNSRLELPAPQFSIDSHRSDLSRSPRGSLASTSSLRRVASERSSFAFGSGTARFSNGGWSARSSSSGGLSPRRRSSSPGHSRFDQLYSLHADRLNRFSAGEEGWELDSPSPSTSARAEALTERLYTEELKKREEKRQERERRKEEELARQTPFSPSISQGRTKSPHRPGQRQLELYELRTELAEKRKQLQDKNVQREQERIAANSVHRSATDANSQAVAARLYDEAKEKKQRMEQMKMEKEAKEMRRLQADAVPKKIVHSRQEEEEVIDRLLHPEPRRRQAELQRAEESKWLDPAMRRPSVGSPKPRRPKAARTASPPAATGLTTPKTRNLRDFLNRPFGSRENSQGSPSREQQTNAVHSPVVAKQADMSQVPPKVEQGIPSHVLPDVQLDSPPSQVQSQVQEPVPRRMTPELQQEHMRRKSREVQLEVAQAVQQVQQTLQHAQLAPLDSSPQAAEKMHSAAETKASEEAQSPAEVAPPVVEAEAPQNAQLAPLESDPPAAEKAGSTAKAKVSEEARSPAEVGPAIVEASESGQVLLAPTAMAAEPVGAMAAISAAQCAVDGELQTGLEVSARVHQQNSKTSEEESEESAQEDKEDNKESFLADLDECW